jgi:Mg2+ and Co2+ transporter CorA
LSGQATPAGLPSLPPPPPQAVEGIPLEDYSDAAEVLLEAYLAEVESIQLNLVLASNRNQLLRVEISITTFTAAMTACTVVASYLGMNLNNGWNTPELTESSYAVFVAICIGCSAGAIALSLLFCLYMRRRGILQ